MKLDLRSIIDSEGSRLPFRFEVDDSELDFDTVTDFTAPVICEGSVENHAGALSAVGSVEASFSCVCARCLRALEKSLSIPFTAYLAEELQDEDSEDYYLIEGDEVDIGEVARDALVLNMPTRFLCDEDCKGLCPKCGKNLNEGPCDCGEDQDPRLAALAQLLEN
ncbi:MAG: DUF177 domain-containing protein [Oscillospiraceae bacterium]|nr:DUF177 domain-containing protein [Oscillospiraceae bacterium]